MFQVGISWVFSTVPAASPPHLCLLRVHQVCLFDQAGFKTCYVRDTAVMCWVRLICCQIRFPFLLAQSEESTISKMIYSGSNVSSLLWASFKASPLHQKWAKWARREWFLPARPLLADCEAGSAGKQGWMGAWYKQGGGEGRGRVAAPGIGYPGRRRLRLGEKSR